MITSVADLIPYLIRHGLAVAGAVVDGGLEVMDASRRNQNHRVEIPGSPSYLIKQGGQTTGLDTVCREAAVYTLLHQDPAYAGLRRHLPRLHRYDADEGVLVLELIAGAGDLRAYHGRQGRFSTGVAREVGRLLASLHRLPPPSLPGSAHHEPPWALSAHHPTLAFLHGESAGIHYLIRLIQQYPDFCQLLDQLRAEWRPTAFLHGDVRWDNLLVQPGRSLRAWLVDWELAGPGDPCWEAGVFLHEYLNFWLGAMPISGETPPERFMEFSRYPLPTMQPAIQAFWSAYAGSMGFDRTTARTRLLLTVRYCGARLIQGAYELLKLHGQVTGQVICQLQLSLNMLQRPEQAAIDLLGIPSGGGGGA